MSVLCDSELKLPNLSYDDSFKTLPIDSNIIFFKLFSFIIIFDI